MKTELDPAQARTRVSLRLDLLDDLKRALFETPYDAELFVAVDTALVDYLRKKRAKPAWEPDAEGCP